MPVSENTRRRNELLLARLSAFLNGQADAITAQMVAAMTGGYVDQREAFSLLLASLCGLDIADSADDRALYRRYFPLMVRHLDVRAYRDDPYHRAVRVGKLRDGAWTLCTQSYKPFEAFVCGDMDTLPDGRVIPRIGYFDEPFEYPAVLENGREWMTVTPNEIETMKPAVDAATGRVLTYGLGLGYFAFMAAGKPQVSSVTVVERDAAVIRLFKKHILPHFPHPEKLVIVQADAFDFAAQDMVAGKFDVVFTDLWHDPSDGIALYLRMKEHERYSPQSRFVYWIEQTLRCYL